MATALTYGQSQAQRQSHSYSNMAVAKCMCADICTLSRWPHIRYIRYIHVHMYVYVWQVKCQAEHEGNLLRHKKWQTKRRSNGYGPGLPPLPPPAFPRCR